MCGLPSACGTVPGSNPVGWQVGECCEEGAWIAGSIPVVGFGVSREMVLELLAHDCYLPRLGLGSKTRIRDTGLVDTRLPRVVEPFTKKSAKSMSSLLTFTRGPRG